VVSLGSAERDEAQLLADHTPSLLARLQVLTAALAGSLSEVDVAEALVEHAILALGATAGVVAIEEEGTLRIAASRGHSEELMERWRTIPVDAPVPIADSVRTREPIYLLSLEERDRRYPILAGERADNRAFLVVPFVIEDRALGALALSFLEPKSLLDADKSFMLAVAQQGAVALERAHLYDAERRARHEAEEVRDRLSFLSEVSGLLAKTLDHRGALATVGALAAARFADWCAIDLLDENGEIERIVVTHEDAENGAGTGSAQGFRRVDPDREVGSPAVIRSGEPELYSEVLPAMIDHLAQDEAERDALRSLGVRSAMIVPLQARGATLGAMTFVSTGEGRRYAPDDLDFAMLVALRAAIEIANARLFKDVTRAEEASRFQRVLLESQSEATIDGILAVSPEGRILFANKRFAEMWGIPEKVMENGSDEGALNAIASALEDPDTFLARVRWLYEHPDESSRDEVRLKDGRIFDRWSAPLLTEGVTYGRAWYFRDVTSDRRIEERLALEERRSTFLADISAILAGARNERALFDDLAGHVVPFLADWCIVDLAQSDGTFDRVAVAHQDAAMVELADRVSVRRHYNIDPNAAHGVPKVLRTGESDFALDIPDSWIDLLGEHPEYREMLKPMGFRSYISVPLTARGRVLGAITMVTAGSRRTYTHEDVGFAEEIGRRASIALDNLRLLSERSATARSLQESLLPPRLPLIPGVALAARYRAAGEGNEVGGDFYDVFPAASGGWALVVGDVCGKGPEAAALTALVRYTIRTLSMQIRKPRRILARLNDAILSQRSDGRFCTLAYGRLDVDPEGLVSVKLSSGGHPLPILVRVSGEVRTIGRTGTLLGVFPDAVSPETSVALDPGDAIVFYTDGVTEARSESSVFGEAGLIEILGPCSGAEAPVIAHLVDQAVRDFQAGDQRDDIAVLVVQAVRGE
jgi:serine phosphatase RsbU (regulator of sigma subunit)/PAS domain-containing protein